MTYKELAVKIAALTPEQQEMDATISLDLSEEAVPVISFIIIQDGDILGNVLDADHPVITIDY